MALLKLKNGWVVDTSYFYSKQGIIQISKYAFAFSMGSFITSLFLWNWVQKLTGCNFQQLLVKISLQYKKREFFNASGWRISQLLSSSANKDDAKQPHITRPSTYTIMMDDALRTLRHHKPESPEQLVQLINAQKVNVRKLASYFPSAFVSKSCISRFEIHQNKHKTLCVWRCNWPGSSNANGAIIHFHGGAFLFGCNRMGDSYAATLSQLTGLTVYLVEWGLAPEYLHPSGVQDVIDAYDYILQHEVDLSADKVFLSGGSAGANIVLLALQKLSAAALKDETETKTDGALPPQPRGCILSSPVCDLSLSNESYEINKDLDCVMSRELYTDLFSYAVGNIDTDGRKREQTKIDMKDATISPLFGNFKGIVSRVYIWVSMNECLYGEIMEVIAKCIANNVDITYEENQWLWHDGMVIGLNAPEARASMLRVAQWIKNSTTPS